jgi:hypothetical protein
MTDAATPEPGQRGIVDRVLDWVWLAPEDATALGLVRIAVVSVLLASMLTHVGAIDAYFSSASTLQGEWAREAFPSRTSLFFWIEAPWAVRTIFAIGVAAHVLWIVGRWTTAAAIVSWVVWVSMAGRQPLLYSLPDQLQMVLCTLLMVMPTGRGLSLDARRRGPRTVPVWCRRVLMIQIATLYTATGLLKHGNTWHRDYTALYYTLVNPYNRHFDEAGFFASLQPWLLRPATAVVVWWEICFAIFLVLHALRHEARRYLGPRRWLVDLRWPMLGFGVAMHVGIQIALYVAWFSPLVVSSYLAFMTPDEAGRLVARLSKRRRAAATTR